MFRPWDYVLGTLLFLLRSSRCKAALVAHRREPRGSDGGLNSKTRYRQRYLPRCQQRRKGAQETKRKSPRSPAVIENTLNCATIDTE